MPPKPKAAPSGRGKRPAQSRVADPYLHTVETPMRPEVGMQAQFRKKKAPKTYRYDSSLDPALSWDGQNAARGIGEWLLARITEASRLSAPHMFSEPQQLLGADGEALLTVRGLEDAVAELGRLGKPFLDWTGKAERLSMDVPTLPLFVHERLSTKVILETLKGHVREGVDEQPSLFFGDKRQPLGQKLRPYEHAERWENRMILGDSLVVMNSLLEYEGMGGKVQMIYIDPPYGVKFGSNFQPFVRKRDVKHNDDADLTREPEMVQAYRDTWELGLHSYLTYLRDRLLVARDLLTPSGSVFVQISDENLHHVREVMDEVFGANNLCSIIPFKKTSGAGNPNGLEAIGSVADYLVWYARDVAQLKYRQLYVNSEEGRAFDATFTWVHDDTGKRPMTKKERNNEEEIIGRRFARADLSAQNDNQMFSYTFGSVTYTPKGRGWRTTEQGLKRLESEDRLVVSGRTLRFVQYADDFAFSPLQAMWVDTGTGSFLEDKLYVVQTGNKVLERCLLMTTDPGDLVVDPTCGSGTTAYVAEQWGRRWITIDTSRVPLALARQRLLTATFPWYKTRDNGDVPAVGFCYERRQNRKGEEVGGIVPHITLKSIANNEPPEQEVLVDRPEVDKNVTRVTGPFAFEATIPTPIDTEGQEKPESERAAEPTVAADADSYADRMLDVLKRSPLLRLDGNRTVQMHSIRVPVRTLSLSAEAMVEATAEGQQPTLDDVVGEAAERNGSLLEGMTRKPVAIVFGPENGAVSERLVYEAAREAYGKSYTHLYVIGFAIEAEARQFVANCGDAMGVSATYVQATMDLKMGDLLKNMRSSQIFSVCGLPEVALRKAEGNRYEAELLGLDVFDPILMENDHQPGANVPAWFLDTDYNGLCFHVTQAFFPKTGAWDALKKSLKSDYDESLWDHLAGTVSAPFEAGAEKRIAVKVIDARGNELMVVKSLSEAKA